MMGKTWKLLAISLASISVVKSEEGCEFALRRAEYVRAERLCESEFQRTGSEAALTLWIDALAQQRRFNQIDSVIAALGDKSLQANAMMRASYQLWNNADPTPALTYYQRSAKLFAELHQPARQAQALHGVFYASWLQADYRKALTAASESLRAAERAQNSEAQVTALTDLFVVLEETGHLDAAQEVLFEIEQRLDPTSPTHLLVNLAINRALIDLHRERFALAIEKLERALTLDGLERLDGATLRALHLNLVHAHLELNAPERARRHLEIAWRHANPDRSMRTALHFYQSQLHFKEGDFTGARESLSDALAQPDLPPVWVWESQFWLGKAAEAMGDDAGAARAYDASIGALESLRAELAFDELKAHLMRRKRQAYEALFLLHMRHNRVEEAIAISERAKARSFLDAFIRNSEPGPRGSASLASVADVADRLDCLRGYLSRLLASQATEPRSVQAAQQRLNGSRLISYFFAEGRLFAIELSGQGARVHEARIEARALEDLLFRYGEDPNDREVLEQLGELVLPKPLRPEAGTHLLLSPDGPLEAIGFGSVRIENAFLAEHYTHSLVPSANAWLLIKDRPARGPTPSGTLVVGDPLGDLPAAREEAEELANRFGAKAYVGHNARTEHLSPSQPVRTLHIATHSGLGHLGPWLRFADGEVAGEALAQLLPEAELVVLASCASGAHGSIGLWGSLGAVLLSRPTPSVLVSLRSVPDRDTQLWMRHFYEAYAAGASPAAAVASAQRSAIGLGIEPGSWSAFALLGSSE